MSGRRTKLLKVGNVDGERIQAEVFSYDGTKVMIRVAFVPEVLKDKPAFAIDGRIVMTVDKRNYRSAIQKIESYLENLFLKELSNADVPASSGAGTDSRGNESSSASDNAAEDQREGYSASIHGSSRRKKSAKSSGGGSETPALDESSGEAASE